MLDTEYADRPEDEVYRRRVACRAVTVLFHKQAVGITRRTLDALISKSYQDVEDIRLLIDELMDQDRQEKAMMRKLGSNASVERHDLCARKKARVLMLSDLRKFYHARQTA